MTSLSDLDTIVPQVINQLQAISDKMSRYKKIDTDLRGRALMSEIKAKIDQIKKAVDVYKRPDLRVAYQDYNFDTFVANIRSYIPECEAVYKRITQSENITGYFSDGPLKEEKAATKKKPEETPVPPQPGEE